MSTVHFQIRDLGNARRSSPLAACRAAEGIPGISRAIGGFKSSLEHGRIWVKGLEPGLPGRAVDNRKLFLDSRLDRLARLRLRRRNGCAHSSICDLTADAACLCAVQARELAERAGIGQSIHGSMDWQRRRDGGDSIADRRRTAASKCLVLHGPGRAQSQARCCRPRAVHRPHPSRRGRMVSPRPRPPDQGEMSSPRQITVRHLCSRRPFDEKAGPQTLRPREPAYLAAGRGAKTRKQCLKAGDDSRVLCRSRPSPSRGWGRGQSQPAPCWTPTANPQGRRNGETGEEASPRPGLRPTER